MSNLTTTLAVLIQGCQAKDPHRFEYRIYEVIDKLMDIQGWGDERRSDLYALITESVTAEDTMVELERKVDAALTNNAQRFYG